MDKVQEMFEERPRRIWYKLIVSFIVIALIVWSGSGVEFHLAKGNGLVIAQNMLRGIVHPDLELLFDLSNQGILYLLFETICIAFLGTIVGAIISIPLSFLGASNIVVRPVVWITRMVIMIIRTIPSFVYGLMFIRVTGPGPFAGLLTMSLCSIGMLTKLNIETIENLDISILESLDSIGCTTFEKIRYGIFPQLTANFLSTIIYRFDMNLRDASVLGLVGAGGIGAPLLFAMNSYKWNQVGSILIGLVVLILLIELGSTKIRAKLVNG